jgi:four helix bundle protein
MEHHKLSTNTNPAKPFDIRERSFVFVCDVILAAQKLHRRDDIARELSSHLVECSMNAAANPEEASDGSSSRDFRAKDRIALREFKESRLRLRVLRATGYLTGEHDPLVREANELVNIVATMIRNSAANEARRSRDR